MLHKLTHIFGSSHSTKCLGKTREAWEARFVLEALDELLFDIDLDTWYVYFLGKKIL